MYPRGGACTATVAYPTFGFAAEKDIPKVVSDGVNPIFFLLFVGLLRPKRRNLSPYFAYVCIFRATFHLNNGSPSAWYLPPVPTPPTNLQRWFALPSCTSRHFSSAYVPAWRNPHRPIRSVSSSLPSIRSCP